MKEYAMYSPKVREILSDPIMCSTASYAIPSTMPTRINRDDAVLRKTYLIGPIDVGFGASYAELLRKYLIRCSVGTAITSMQVLGVTNIYPSQMIPGIKEDTEVIRRNISKIKWVMPSYNASICFTVNVKGPCIVTTRLFCSQTEHSFLNTDTYICEVYAGYQYSFLFFGDVGYGYVPSNYYGERNSVLYCDAFFSPILNISYDVVSHRLYEEILLSIDADKSTHLYFEMQKMISLFNMRFVPSNFIR